MENRFAKASDGMGENPPYAIEMLNITKRFPGIIANDNITLQLTARRNSRLAG